MTQQSIEYTKFQESCALFENNTHYSELMCMKECGSCPKPADKCHEYITESELLSNRESLKNLCVLPTGHSGRCSRKFDIFKKSNTTDKLISSIDHSVYTTPGNDDFVYKNRGSRLFPFVLSRTEEKKIRNKEIKKKCSIPLKDASTPILLAQAYLDWLTFVVNIVDIKEHLVTEGNEAIFEMLQKNKTHLSSIFHNRNIFDKNGNTICVITKNTTTVTDFADAERDNRVNIKDTDIQLGHNVSRDDCCVSIRGENLFPMSRRGNLIIGERVFTEDVWLDELRAILSANL